MSTGHLYLLDHGILDALDAHLHVATHQEGCEVCGVCCGSNEGDESETNDDQLASRCGRLVASPPTECQESPTETRNNAEKKRQWFTLQFADFAHNVHRSTHHESRHADCYPQRWRE